MLQELGKIFQGEQDMKFSHELVMPNEDLPFKMFLFEGVCGNYFRDKHWHRSVEIFAVFEGRLDFYLNNEVYPLSSGEFMLVNSNEIHSIDAVSRNYTIVLQIPLKAFEKYYTAQQFVRFTHDKCGQDAQIMGLIRDMYTTYCEKQRGYEMKVVSRYYMLLYFLVSVYRETEVTPRMVKENERLGGLSEITNYIKENYRSELSLESLAEIFGYSPAYLSRMLKRYAGINYKAYLQSVRLECAYQELVNSARTISSIAMEHGFASSKAFTRAFQSKYGMSPSEYRGKEAKRKEKA